MKWYGGEIPVYPSWWSLVCGNGSGWVKASNDLQSMSIEAVLAKFKVLSKLRKNTQYDVQIAGRWAESQISFIALYTMARQWPLSWATWIHSSHLGPVSSSSNVISISPCIAGPPKWSLFFMYLPCSPMFSYDLSWPTLICSH